MFLVLLGQAHVSWEALPDMCITHWPGLSSVQLKYIKLPLEIQNYKVLITVDLETWLVSLESPFSQINFIRPFLSCLLHWDPNMITHRKELCKPEKTRHMYGIKGLVQAFFNSQAWLLLGTLCHLEKVPISFFSSDIPIKASLIPAQIEHVFFLLCMADLLSLSHRDP